MATTLIQALDAVLLRDVRQSDRELIETDPGSRSGITRFKSLSNALSVHVAPPSGVSGAANRWLFPLFVVGAPDVTRMCDYILFCPRERDQRMVVLLCELKSSNTKGALVQLRSGMLLAEYVLNVALLHCRPTLVPTIEYRGVVFGTDAKVQRLATRAGAGVDFRADDRTGLPHTLQRAGDEYSLDAFCAPTAIPTRPHRSDPCVVASSRAPAPPRDPL